MRAAVVTGAAGALGTALRNAYRAAGYFVVGTDHVEPASSPDAFVNADLAVVCADSGAMVGFADRLRQAVGGRSLGALVHCAAVQIRASVEGIRPEDWRRTLEINVNAPFFLTQALLPDLERAGGVVVNVGSVHARATKPAFVAYATSKAALEGLTRAMAVDLGGRVRVVVVHPAAIDTPMLRAGFEGKEDLLGRLAAAHPIGRIAAPDEIARFVVFLTTSGASFATGSTFVLDGGVLSRLHDPE